MPLKIKKKKPAAKMGKRKTFCVTARWLLETGACASSVAIFKEIFPRGGPITIANLRKAYDNGLSISMLLDFLLTPRQRNHAIDKYFMGPPLALKHEEKVFRSLQPFLRRHSPGRSGTK